MNQAAQKQNPPSRMSKDELRVQNEKLAEQTALLDEENERMKREIAMLRQQSSKTTDDVQKDAIIDPETGKPLVPALSEEELRAQDEAIAQTYDDQMAVTEGVQPEPIKPVETNRFSTMAKHSPAIIRPSMETDERETGFHGKIQEFSDNRIGQDKFVEHAREVDVLAAKNKQANINFMKELVTIHIMQASGRDDDKIFSIGVNGRQWRFERNKEYTVPRYVVEGLLRAKPMTYGNEEYTKNNGERSVRWPIQQGVRYPFAIVQDNYPHWRKWMAFTMAQPD